MIYEERFIPLPDGGKVYSQVRENGNKVWLISLHGLKEHLGRHAYLPEIMSHTYNICQFDLRGHGRSSGRRCYIDYFDQYVEDLSDVISYLKITFNMKHFILLGHSMGALIVANYIQNVKTEYPDKVILSSIPVGFTGVGTKYLPQKIVETISWFPWSFNIDNLANPKLYSHDLRVYEEFILDPLNCTKVHTKLLRELLKTSKKVFSLPLRAQCPLYCALGTGDKVININNAKNYFSHMEKGTQLLLVDGGYHELHNEVERYRKPYFDFLKNILRP